MKKLLLLAVLLLGTSPAWADMGDDGPEPVIPTFPPCHVWLGDPVAINHLWYIPVMVSNERVRNIRNLWGWGDFDPDIELTGTLRVANSNYSLQGHLNGNYWPYLAGGGLSLLPPQFDSTGTLYALNIFGAWDLPLNGPSDCASLPYPEQTSGVLVYLRLIGEGTARFARNKMWSGNVCNLPAISYIEYGVVHRTIQFPPPQEPGGEPGGVCGGDPSCIEGLGASVEAKPAQKKRVTWGSLKAIYR